jgi:hypothetical protein
VTFGALLGWAVAWGLWIELRPRGEASSIGPTPTTGSRNSPMQGA